MLKKLLFFAFALPTLSSGAVVFNFSDYDDMGGTCTLRGWTGQQPPADELLEIPATTTRNGKTYNVTKVASGALDNFTMVKEIKISSYIEKIGQANSNIVGNCENFRNCPNLRKISVSATNPEFSSILDGVLANKSGYTIIRVPQAFQPDGGNTALRIPTGVTSICPAAFSGNTQLTAIGLPASLYNLRSNCGFNDMPSLQQFVVNGPDTPAYFSIMDNVLYNKEATEILSYPPKRGGVSFTVPQSVKKIGKRSFANTSNLTSINFDNVDEIAEEAFEGCGIPEINFPNKNLTIEDAAFRGCGKLTKMFIPHKVVIPRNFARDCPALKSVTMLDLGSELKDNAFKNCRNLTFFNFSVDKKYEGDSIFAGCGFKEVSFAAGISPAGGIDLGKAMFADCPNLELIDLSTIVTLTSDSGVSIGLSFASGCGKLKSVMFPYITSFWTSLDKYIPCFGVDSPIEKIVLGAFSIGSAFGAPLYYTKTMQPASMYLCTSLSAVETWPVANFFHAENDAIVRPLIYSDNYSLLHPSVGLSSQFIYPNARYFVPGGTYENYKEAAQHGCTVQEMYDINMVDNDGCLSIVLSSRMGADRLIFKEAYVDNDRFAFDTEISAVVSTKPYVGKHTVKLSYLLDDVKMTTIYDVNLSEGGAGEITSDAADAETEYFTLQGIHLKSAPDASGIYIKRCGKKVEKIFLTN
ncbi:MAG: leucine-rich repeat domain-containing protein [Candidatus Amulumruptor caecigallinarius]|nr:leucine-rich repeat domain-containing protein [Candidatus Amulumruptor caecigallinarius]